MILMRDINQDKQDSVKQQWQQFPFIPWIFIFCYIFRPFERIVTRSGTTPNREAKYCARCPKQYLKNRNSTWLILYHQWSGSGRGWLCMATPIFSKLFFNRNYTCESAKTRIKFGFISKTLRQGSIYVLTGLKHLHIGLSSPVLWIDVIRVLNRREKTTRSRLHEM